jgi:hypothetical protein
MNKAAGSEPEANEKRGRGERESRRVFSKTMNGERGAIK